MAEDGSSGAGRNPPGEGTGAPRPDDVRAELQRILESHEFRSSKRCQDFLRFVVENTLNGRADILKERTIGVEAFGRPASYEPSDDATVRVKAGEVRKRLGLYYASVGANDPVRIELPGGGYVPEFTFHPNGGMEKRIHPVEEREKHGVFVSRGFRIALMAGALAAVGVTWFELAAHRSELNQFWAPVLRGSSPVLLCAAYVPVYTPALPGGSVGAGANFTLLNDQFVGGGDLVAAARLSAMLTRMGRAYQLRIGHEVSFQDLRTSPAILIGYSYTRWREISKELRYFIDASRQPAIILDNGKPTSWYLPRLGADRHTDEDYAIVSRVFHPDTRAMLVELAGITQYGTEAASDLLSNPELLAEALHGAPKNWQRENLQLVLHVKVISGTPAPPTVVASHFW
jgi:hypothetical protein